MSENRGEKHVFSQIDTNFNSDVVKETLKLNFAHSKTKINEDAVELIKEIAKALAAEACIRAAKYAKIEDKSVVNLSHVEAILPQIMLDFP